MGECIYNIHIQQRIHFYNKEVLQINNKNIYYIYHIRKRTKIVQGYFIEENI